MFVLLLCVISAQDCYAQKHRAPRRPGERMSPSQVESTANKAFELFEKKQYKEAFGYMLDAAIEGDCVSQGNIGTMYYMGLGHEIDYEKARDWWLKAVEGGCGDRIKDYLESLVFVVDGIRYAVNNDNSVTVFPYKVNNVNYSGLNVASIPNKVSHNNHSYPVTSISEKAFEDCTNLTSVTIGNSVTSIGSHAFDGCKNLSSVTIPNSVSFVDRRAFYGTPWYDNQPDGVVYAGLVAYEFKGEMPENTSITLREGTKGIANSAFRSKNNLISVNIPNSVTTIGDWAFNGCKNLTSVNIPSSLTTMGAWVFQDCVSITSITVPATVAEIGDWAFERCKGLTSVTFLGSKTKIGGWAFQDCENLTSLTIPDDLEDIGMSAFHGCPTSPYKQPQNK